MQTENAKCLFPTNTSLKENKVYKKLAVRLLMHIAETIGGLLCYRTKPTFKFMRSDAITSGIGNA
jgi:hypothetical protein